jgi:broad specificity phosphatase PhoE
MEKQPTIENFEQPKAKIELHFFRHDEKESDKTKSDFEIRLTESGRKHAKSLSDSETNISQSVAFGSPRKRTQETAGLQMAGFQEEITGEESLEELKKKLNKDLDYGSKLNTDKRLDFILPTEGQYLEEGLRAFREGKLLEWLVEKSDQRLKDLGAEDDYFSYSNQAKQIAQIIEKYVKILPRWKQLVEDDSKDYEPEMERFMGTHQSVSECFLAKVIELTKGTEDRDKFVDILSGQGFDFGEGFEIDIEESEDEEPQIYIRYKKESEDSGKSFEFNEIVTKNIINQIVSKKN